MLCKKIIYILFKFAHIIFFDLDVHFKNFISVFNQLHAQNLFYNKFYFMPLHVSSTCSHHQEVKISLHSLWYHHTYRCDDTRGCVTHFWPLGDEHMCSKHVEAWNKTIVKQMLCIKLVKYWDKYTKMHGQQNDKISRTVTFSKRWRSIDTFQVLKSIIYKV